MINCSLLVTLSRIIYNFLTAIGALVPLLCVSRINNLFLISLKHLRGMSSYCATTSLLKAKATAMLLLGAERDAATMLSLIYLLVHLACFVPTVDI